MVHIIGQILRYIEPFIAESEHGRQAGGSYKGLLCEAEAIHTDWKEKEEWNKYAWSRTTVLEPETHEIEEVIEKRDFLVISRGKM